MSFTDEVPQGEVTLEAAIVALIDITPHEQEINGAKNFATEINDVLNEYSQRLDYLRLLVQEALTLSDEDFVQGYAAFTEAESDPLGADFEAITRQAIEALGLDLDLAAFDSAPAVVADPVASDLAEIEDLFDLDFFDFGFEEDFFVLEPEASEDDADEAEVVCPLCHDYGDDAEAAYEAGYAAGIEDASVWPSTMAQGKKR